MKAAEAEFDLSHLRRSETTSGFAGQMSGRHAGDYDGLVVLVTDAGQEE
jgi:hypothetical protein